MVTDTKAPEVRQAAATGELSDLERAEKAEAEALALFEAGDYERGLSACRLVIHFAHNNESDAAAACFERLIQRLAQLIYLLTEVLDKVKPDAEMVRVSFAATGLMTFARHTEAKPEGAAIILYDRAIELFAKYKEWRDNETEWDELVDFSELPLAGRVGGWPIPPSKGLGLDYTDEEVIRLESELEEVIRLQSELDAAQHGGPVGDAAEITKADIFARVDSVPREKLPALAKLIEDFVSGAKEKTTARENTARTVEQPRPEIPATGVQVFAEAAAKSSRRKTRHVFTPEELQNPRSVDRALDTLADIEAARRAGSEIPEPLRLEGRRAKALLRKVGRLTT